MSQVPVPDDDLAGTAVLKLSFRHCREYRLWAIGWWNGLSRLTR